MATAKAAKLEPECCSAAPLEVPFMGLAVVVVELKIEAFEEDIIEDVIEAVSTFKVPDGMSLSEEAVMLSGSVLAAIDMLMVLLAGSAVALEAVEVAQYV
ncbi:hypothetical protein KC318_g6681 [Hortaea werneckii]|nr:hypothetical protein KC334_g8851 [Hortaea werneckii]KAI6952842.1 hypothetical protein KC355_g13876 [Hortaea werneckii]KAI7666188.1 hypothetical protein KC318_g6681 [Hortaea werneckii]